MRMYVKALAAAVGFLAIAASGPVMSEFNPCTWGWILENCPSAKCDKAKECRQHVIDTWLERAKNGQCSAADASKIRLSCEGCNRTFCK